MKTSETDGIRRFDGDSFEKTNLFETERFFADVYCFEPGQRQELHRHAGSDKVYYVLEGEAEFTVGEETETLGSGDAVLAEAGKQHGVRADERSRVLVFMAPHPSHTDDENGDEDVCDHGDGHAHGSRHGHGTDGEFGFGFVTVSTSRDPSDDESGDVAREFIEERGHRFAEYSVVDDESEVIRDTVGRMVEEVDTVVTSGGTGLTDDDVTVEALRPVFDKEIPGFGEEFRRRSIDEVGLAGMLSRSTAGVIDDTPVFILPGSPDAVETGLEIVVSEVGHVLGLVRRG